jgi:hypothetical protein
MAGLAALTISCKQQGPQVRLHASVTLAQFPSASAIEYDDGRLYLFGDDAPYLLVLDTQFHAVRKLRYLDDTSYRIPKETKADVEAVTIHKHRNKRQLVAFGSWSAPSRRSVFTFPLPLSPPFSQQPLPLPFLEGIKEWNIEGAASVGNQFVLANRANTTTRVNHLIIIPAAGVTTPGIVKAIRLSLPASRMTTGISGLYYDVSRDLLLFTASEEDTPNAIADGAIGDSYLGWITNFRAKMRSAGLSPQGLINLSQNNPAFKGQKIESLCVGNSTRHEMTVYLAADNDNGQSKLFKISLRL